MKEVQRFSHKNNVQLMDCGTNYDELEYVSSGSMMNWMVNQYRYTSIINEGVQRLLIYCTETHEHFHRVIRRA